MINHSVTDEREATATRENCGVCRRIVVPHEHTEQGWLCRKCTDSATIVRLEYVIEGRLFSKFLKGRGPAAVKSAKSVK
jgi:hypothetical protein